jgi:hypothetical protein
MPSFLDARDIRLLIGTGAVMLVLLGVTYVVAPPPAEQSTGYPSTYSSDWSGAEAAFLLLDEGGYHVERWEETPEDLPTQSQGLVLILADPFMGATEDERAAIRRFVAGGGRVLALSAAAAALVPEADAKEVPEWNPEAKRYSALTNGAIRDQGNLAFFLNCVGAPGNSRILWDEYFHGARGTLASYFAKTPLPWAGLQVALAFVAVMFTFSRRAGPVRVPATESRLSPLEFVNTLGDLYKSAHASPAAVAVAYRRFRFALSRKLALPANTKLPELTRAAAGRFGWQAESLLDTLARSERAMRSIKPDEREALYLVRQLHDYSASLEPQGRAVQEIPAWR